MPMHASPLPSKWIVATLGAFLDGQPPSRQLTMADMACGSGRHIRPLQRWLDTGQLAITAVDRDAGALASLPKTAQITPLQIDLEAGSQPLAALMGHRRFDIVLTANYLYRPHLSSLFHLVRPGGLFVYETFGAGNACFGRPSKPEFLLNKGELAQMMPDDFVSLDYFHGQRRDIDPAAAPAIIQHLSARRRPLSAPLSD